MSGVRIPSGSPREKLEIERFRAFLCVDARMRGCIDAIQDALRAYPVLKVQSAKCKVQRRVKRSATFVRETKDCQTERRETFKRCALCAHIFLPAEPARREAPIPVLFCTKERPVGASSCVAG